MLSIGLIFRLNYRAPLIIFGHWAHRPTNLDPPPSYPNRPNAHMQRPSQYGA
ncbi:MAG: hypothetical protein NEHIOOID_01070 [Holosporales bacterium]